MPCLTSVSLILLVSLSAAFPAAFKNSSFLVFFEGGFLQLRTVDRKFAEILGKRSHSNFTVVSQCFFNQVCLHGVLNELCRTFRRVEVDATTLTDDLEARNFWLVEVDLRRENHSQVVMLEEGVGEGSTEEGAIKIDFASLGNVDFLAARAVYFEARGAQGV